MSSKLFLLTIISFFSVLINAQINSARIIEEPVQFSRGEATYSGTFSKPVGNGKFPVVVLISGMGLQDRDWTFVKGKYSLAKMLSDSLNNKGMAVLRYDDRGYQQSTGTKETVTSFADLAEDVYAAVLALRKRKDVGKIGLIGHSLGGILAVMAAARHPDIDFIVTLAGSYQTGGEIMMEQARTLKRWKTSDSMTEAEVITNGETFVHNWMAYAAGKAAGLDIMKIILKDLLRYQIKHLSPEDSLENMKIHKDTATMLVKEHQNVVAYYTSPHQQSFAIYNPESDFVKLTCPVLVLFGQKDQHVTVKSNLPKVSTAVSVAGMGNVTIHVLPEADHSFSAAGGMQTGKMTPGLAANIACWIQTMK